MSENKLISLLLFGTDGTETTYRARANLSRLLKNNNHNEAHYEFIDVLIDPVRSLTEGILVTPTLLIRDGSRRHVIVGALDDKASVDAILSRLPREER